MNNLNIIRVRGFALSLVLCLVSLLTSYAQHGKKIISFGYSAGIPLNGLNDFIENRNFDGIYVDGRYFLLDKLSAGITVGSNDFTKTYERQIYENTNGSISSVRTKYFQTSPMLLTGHFYFNGTESRISPYIGAGMGAYSSDLVQWDGTFSSNETRISFGLKPEAGFLIKIWGSVGINIKAGYNHLFYSTEILKNAGFLEANGGVYISF